VVETLRGSVTVAWKGNRAKTALVTYHDLGLNHISNFKVGDLTKAVSFFYILRKRGSLQAMQIWK
jgi:hypothetical protein